MLLQRYKSDIIIKNIMAKIYVASSWRNSYQQDVVSFLRNEGHEVYDFTHPNGDMS